MRELVAELGCGVHMQSACQDALVHLAWPDWLRVIPKKGCLIINPAVLMKEIAAGVGNGRTLRNCNVVPLFFRSPTDSIQYGIAAAFSKIASLKMQCK